MYNRQENQLLLWNTINKHPQIYKLPNDRRQSWFQQCIQNIRDQYPPHVLNSNLSREHLNELNQKSIIYMVNELKSIPSSQQDSYFPAIGSQRSDIRSHPSRPSGLASSDNTNVPASMYSVKKSDTTSFMQQQLFEKQKELEFMMQKPKPDAIEIPTENVDEPIKNMDELIQQHMKFRELDIAPFPTTQTIPSTPSSTPILNITSESVPISVTDIDQAPKKHVTFRDDLEKRVDALEKRVLSLQKLFENLNSETEISPINATEESET
jgi:hypothetical protein